LESSRDLGTFPRYQLLVFKVLKVIHHAATLRTGIWILEVPSNQNRHHIMLYQQTTSGCVMMLQIDHASAHVQFYHDS
jgi:hypothetical protein